MVSTLRTNDCKKMGASYYEDNHTAPRSNQGRLDRLQFCLAVFNTVLFIAGCLTLGLSVYGLIRFQLYGYDELFSSVMFATIIPWLAVISGTLSVTMTTLCGCHGVVVHRRSLLVFYFLYLLTMVLADVVMFIWVIVTVDQVQKQIESSIRSGVTAYHQQLNIRKALDDLQQNLGCCGSDNGVIDYGLWGPPPSCKHDKLFTPCIKKMKTLYEDYWIIVVGVLAVIFVILAFTLMLVSMFLSAIKSRRRRVDNRSKSDTNQTQPSPASPPPPPPLPPAPPSAPPPVPTKGQSKNKRCGSQTGVVQLAADYNQSSVV